MVDGGWQRQCRKRGGGPRFARKSGNAISAMAVSATGTESVGRRGGTKERFRRQGGGRCTAKGQERAGSGMRTSWVALCGPSQRGKFPGMVCCVTNGGYPGAASRNKASERRIGRKWYVHIFLCNFNLLSLGSQALIEHSGRGGSRIREFLNGLSGTGGLGPLAFIPADGRLPSATGKPLCNAGGPNFQRRTVQCGVKAID